MLESLAVLLAMGSAGCSGQAGPARYEVSGTVMFAGKPVPTGEISFEPDGAQHNAGPGSMTQIKDGKYRTDPNKGVVGGPYIVRIQGFDGVPVGDSAMGKPIFPPYSKIVDLPKQTSTQDFSVAPSGGP